MEEFLRIKSPQWRHGGVLEEQISLMEDMKNYFRKWREWRNIDWGSKFSTSINGAEKDSQSMASVGIAATDLRAVLNDEKFSPNVKIRNVLIPKQYLVYKDELAVKGKCLQLEKRKRMEGIHTIQNKKSRRRNPPKNRMFFQKRDIRF